MFRDPEGSKRNTRKSSKFIVYARVMVLSLTLLALAGSPGETSRVGAARQFPPAAIAASLNINIGGNGTYCVGRDYRVSVTPVNRAGAIEVDPVTHKEKSVDAPMEAVAVEAFSTNTGVATISPKKAVSGWDVEGNGPEAEAFTGHIVSPAIFSLHANKAGSTRIYFEASIRGNYVGPGVDIKVVPCKYKVTINTTLLGQIPNITETALYTTTGEISGEGTLTGNAKVTWKTQQVSGCFVTNQKVPPSTATIKGTLNEDSGTLTVSATFDALVLSNSVRFTCGYGAASSKQLPFQPPPITVTVSATGGARTYRVNLQIGEVTLPGMATVIVVPIEGK